MQHRLDEALARFGLAGATATFVRAGENTTYRLDGPDGATHALRVHRPGYQTAASVRSEIAWMEALGASGLATPAVVRSDTGEPVLEVDVGEEAPRLVAIFTWIDGQPLARIDQPGLWERLGALMATVHVHGRAWPRPSGFVRQSWDAEGMVGSERPLWGDPVALGTWDAPVERAIVAARATVRERLARLPQTPDRYGLVHADLAFENVIVRPDGEAVLIDFDDCGFSWYLWELAVALFPFDGEPGFDERRDAVVRGYRGVSELPVDVLHELPTFVMARRLAALGWLFTHAGTTHAETQRAWRLRTLVPAAERYVAWAADADA